MTKYALIALACAAGLSTAAFAAGDDIAVSAMDGNTRQATVNISDLNLTQQHDRFALQTRLKRAVSAVCDKDSGCSYAAQRDASRLAGNAIAAAQGGTQASATSLIVSGAR